MMRGCMYGLLLVLSCWAPMAVADQAVSGGATSASMSAEEEYQAGVKAAMDDDPVSAAKLFAGAAERGHAGAQARLAFIVKDGSGQKQALELFRRAAEQGNAVGQYGLGLMHMEKPYLDFAEARKWLTMAADQGYESATIVMAKSYLSGGLGLDEKERNGPETVKWLKRAAEFDDGPMIKELADAYRKGKYGLEVDLKQAAEWEVKYREVTGTKLEKKRTKRRF